MPRMKYRDLEFGITLPETFREVQEDVVAPTLSDIKQNTAELVLEQQVNRDWQWEMTSLIIDKMDAIRALLGGFGDIITAITTVDNSIHEIGDAAAAQRDASLAEQIALRNLLGRMQSQLAEVVNSLSGDSEMTWELLDQIIYKIEALRATNVSIGESIVGGLGVIDGSVEGVSTTVTAEAVTNRAALLARTVEIRTSIDRTITELKRIREANELILGQDVDVPSD